MISAFVLSPDPPASRPRPRRLLAACLVLAGACAAGPLPAKEVAGVDLEETVRLGDAQPLLTLNGAGVRSKFFIKVYVAGLYLTRSAATTEEVLALEGPKRVRMHFLHSEVKAEKIRSAWKDGYLANHTQVEFETLESRVEQFNALFPTLKAGDVVDVDYVPGAGTTVVVNGEARGTVPGEDFHRATLRIWLGDAPAHKGLKKALLGMG